MSIKFSLRVLCIILCTSGLVPVSNSQKQAVSHVSFTVDTSLLSVFNYRELGPWRGGRSAAVTGVPGKANLYYFGSTGGGVWRTIDGGQHWENISDGFFGGSIGAIEVAPSDANVIYAGGGEKTVRGNVSYGYGIWRSVDAGDTWEQAGLKDSRHIPRIRVHPEDHNIVYAAVLGDLFKDSEERGIYKSSDGGRSWRQVLFVNARSGAVDLILDPNNPRIIYASTWRVHRNPWELSSGGEGSALWKSTDEGESWENISGREGLPGGTWGISGIAVSPVNSKRVWAIIENEKGGVYRSDNGGKTWKQVNDDRNLRQRAWYYTRIYADPHNADVIYVMNVAYHKSKDGGKSFQSYYAPHGDHHDLWIAPENPNRMIIGDDGGAQVTHDGGETWTTYHNQPTAQFYRVTTDNSFPFRIYAAQQDNSSIRMRHRSDGRSITDDDWESTAGCECGYLAPRPDDPEIVFGGCYGGLIERKDHRTNYEHIVSVWPENTMGHGAKALRYRFQWNFPIFFSRHDPNKLYSASNYLHQSTDGGQSWKVVSPDLTRNDTTKLGPSGGPITRDNTSVEYYCTIFVAGESPRVNDLLWTGSDDGLVHVRKGIQADWENVTPADLPEWIQINSIEPDPHRDGGCYIAATMYKWGDYRPYLYKTTDNGNTWVKIVDGIDPSHFTRVVRADPNRIGLLFAGTETGLYFSIDDGKRWQPFQLNLPVVPITDLTIRDDKLIVATQGRGLWIFDRLTALRQVLDFKPGDQAKLFEPEPMFRMHGSATKKPVNAGKNFPPGVSLLYYLPEIQEDDTLSIYILSEHMDTIRTFRSYQPEKAFKDTVGIKKGLQCVVWDMRYPDALSFEGMVLWWASMSGPQVPPGNYTAILEYNEDKQQVAIDIRKDPRINTSESDYDSLFIFEKDIHNTLNEAHGAIREIRLIKKQMSDYASHFETDSVLAAKGERIDSILTQIEEGLYQTKNRSNQDPLNFPVKLTNQLAHLNALYNGKEFPPPHQAWEVKKHLEEQINDALSRYEQLKTIEIPELNALILEKKLNWIQVEQGM